MDNRDIGKDNFAGICHCPLRLVTLAPVSIYHHWEMLEDYLVELLAKSFGLDTFGCELMLIAEDTLSPLSDPIYEEIWEDKRFQLVIQKSFQRVSQVRSIEKSMMITPGPSESLLMNQAFSLPKLSLP